MPARPVVSPTGDVEATLDAPASAPPSRRSGHPSGTSPNHGSATEATTDFGRSVPDPMAIFERLVDRFAKSWTAGETPSLDDYLAQAGDYPLYLLIELVHLDLEHRFQAGQGPNVEEYFRRYPQLLSERRVAIDLLVAEFQLRNQNHQQPRLEDFQQRFPEYGGELAVLLRVPPRSRRRRFPIRLHCPHCHNAIAIVDDGTDRDVECPSCHGSFHVDTDRTRTWLPDQLPTIGRFQPLQAVGRGAFGTVYRALDTELGRTVALKVPRRGTFSDRRDEENFVSEARHAAQLNHKGIVRVFDVARTDEFPFIVSEFVDGATLSDVMTARRFGFTEAAALVATIAEALHHAHEHHVVHRDLKPSNIMMDADDQPRIMDFGLAIRNAGEVTMAIDGSILGTPAYMSPEQARGASTSVDRRADIYSLGVILFELLTGGRPFRGNSVMLLHQVAHLEAPRIRDLNHKIPLDLDTIVARCLEKSPAKRFPTALDLAEDLRRHLRHEPILARPIGPLERAARWCKRNPLLVKSASAVFGVLLTALGVVSWSWRNESIARGQADAFALKNQELYEREQVARKEAVVAKDHAVQRLRDARGAADLWLTVFPQQLEELPGGPNVLVSFLQQAANDYERFTQQASDDPQLELERGRSWLRLGDVRRKLADDSAALAAYDQARQVFTKWIQHESIADDARVELAIAEISLGLTHWQLTRPSESEACYAAAIDTLSHGLPSASDNPRAHKVLADAFVNLTELHFRLGRLDQAEDSILNACNEYDVLVRRWPEEPSYRVARANALSLQAVLTTQRGHWEDARRILEQVNRELDAVVQKESDPYDYLRVRAEKRILLAGVLRPLGAVQEELEAYRAAAADYQRIIENRSGTPSLVEQQAIAMIDMGNLLLYLGRPPEAVEPLTQAIVALDKIADAYGRPQYHAALAAARAVLGEAYRELGRAAESKQLLQSAVSIYEQLIDNVSGVVEYAERLAVARGQLAQTLAQMDDKASAIEAFEATVKELEQLRQNAAENPAYQHEMAFAHWHLGEFVLRHGIANADAAQHFRIAYDGWQQLERSSPTAEYADALAWFLVFRATDVGVDSNRAVELATRVHRSQNSTARFQRTLGAALFRNGQYAVSESILNELVKDNRADGFAHLFLSMALARQGKFDVADQQFQAGQQQRATNQPGNQLLRDLEEEARRLLDSK